MTCERHLRADYNAPLNNLSSPHPSVDARDAGFSFTMCPTQTAQGTQETPNLDNKPRPTFEPLNLKGSCRLTGLLYNEGNVTALTVKQKGAGPCLHENIRTREAIGRNRGILPGCPNIHRSGWTATTTGRPRRLMLPHQRTPTGKKLVAYSCPRLDLLLLTTYFLVVRYRRSMYLVLGYGKYVLLR